MSSGTFGTSLYGAGVYGATPPLWWQVMIEWDGTTFVDEGPNLMELRSSRGRTKTLRGANGFEPMGIGELVLTFRNFDGRYDPLNSSSPLYPDVAPGAEVRVSVIHSGLTYDVFCGHIYDIKPIANGANRRAQIIVRDGWQWLKDRKVRAETRFDFRTDEAIDTIATNAGYPFLVLVETGDDTIPYWWAGNRDAMTEIQSVAESECGTVNINRSGILTFTPRSALRGITASHTLTGSNIQELNFAQPWDVVRNVIQVRSYPTEVRTGQVLWRSQAPIRLRAGHTRNFVVDYNLQTAQDEEGLAINVKASALSTVTPVATTDYTAYENADGSGATVTGDISIFVDNLGEQARIEMTNSGTSTAWVTLKLRGAVIIKNNAVTMETDNSGGETARSFVLDVPWQQDVDKAQLYADFLAAFLSDPRAAPTVRMNNAGLDIQLAELFTGYELDITGVVENKIYRSCGVDHSWSALSPLVLNTRLYLEHTDETDYFTLDVSELDSTDELAY